MGKELRCEPRYDVAVGASFEGDGGSRSLVRVTNVSARGCRFHSSQRLEAGSTVSVSFGRAQPLVGKVRWRVGSKHGVRFARRLHPTVLDHIRLFLSEKPALVAERAPILA